MKTHLIKTFVTASMLTLLALAGAGCSTCKPGQPGPIGEYNIEVSLDNSLANSSVIVDLVGVNSSNLPRWEAYDMGKYWKDDPMRNDANKEVMNFVSGQEFSKTLSKTNAVWKKWKGQGVTHVLVLADLPGTHASKPGNQDSRRQTLSLDQCQWEKKTSTLKVRVQRSGILVLTPPRPVK